MHHNQITVRRLALDSCHKLCQDAGLVFYMTSHFIERINLRAHTQNESFANLLGVVRFMLSKQAEFSRALPSGEQPKIGLELGQDYFIMQLKPAQLTGITFFSRPGRNVRQLVVDRRFTLNRSPT